MRVTIDKLHRDLDRFISSRIVLEKDDKTVTVNGRKMDADSEEYKEIEHKAQDIMLQGNTVFHWIDDIIHEAQEL